MNSPGLFLVGRKHTIEFTINDEDGGVDAMCRGAQVDFQHGKNWCDAHWTAKYDDLRDAYEYASDHADTLRA